MKKIILLAILLISAHFMEAQILKKLKQKIDNKVDKTVEDAKNGKKDDNDKKKGDNENSNTGGDNTAKNENSQNNQNNPATIKAYSKYDFVPGEKVIGFEDFSTGSIGDFPAGWNTNASGEILTVEGKPGRWLWFTSRGEFVPEFANPFPEDFTFEFDLLHGIPINGASFTVCIAELANMNQLQYW